MIRIIALVVAAAVPAAVQARDFRCDGWSPGLAGNQQGVTVSILKEVFSWSDGNTSFSGTVIFEDTQTAVFIGGIERQDIFIVKGSVLTMGGYPRIWGEGGIQVYMVENGFSSVSMQSTTCK